MDKYRRTIVTLHPDGAPVVEVRDEEVQDASELPQGGQPRVENDNRGQEPIEPSTDHPDRASSEPPASSKGGDSTTIFS